MSELRVPTIALSADVLCADGRNFLGRIFIPATASRHTGPMRAEEWMSEPAAFFPFLPDGSKEPVLLNRREILVISVPASADQVAEEDEADLPHKRVVIEAESSRLEGIVVIDMPTNRRRVLDYLNSPTAFLTLRDGERHHLIQKERITRVIELVEE